MRKFALVPLVFLTLSMPFAGLANDLPIFGYLEKVRVGPNALIMNAKLDTGADSSSLGYHKLVKFEKNGKPWVRVSVRNFEGKSFTIERRVIRISKIKRHGAPSVERPVIMVSLCLGSIHKFTQVSLADRTKFSTQVLVGRKFLAQSAIVDSGTTYTTPTRCKKGNVR